MYLDGERIREANDDEKSRPLCVDARTERPSLEVFDLN